MLAFVSGCSSGQGTDAGDDGGTAVDAPGVYRSYAPTYDAVWNEVLHFSCAVEFCHGGGTMDYLTLTNESVGYSSLLDMASGPMCAGSGLKRVDPLHPETSLVYLKITSPPCGSKMPLGLAPLGAADIDQIRRWIACGAPDGDAGCAADAGPESSVEAGPGDAGPDDAPAG
jgi:hypothetical protein